MFIIISNQILKMFLLMMVGYLCCRTKLIDHHGNKTLSNLLLMVINPVLIVNAFQIEYSPQLLKNFLLAFLLSLVTHFVGIVLVHFLIPSKSSRDYAVEQFCAVYSNCGFMGIPLINSILGSEGVLYITAYMIAFNLLCWTHGLTLMTGNTSWKQLKKGLTSPVIFGILIGLFLFLTQIHLPALLSETIESLSCMNTPVGMMIAGISLAETDLLPALKNRRLYLVTAVKLIVIPLIMLLAFSLLPISSGVLCTMVVAAACPAATTGTMFALRYDGNYKYASQIFAVTTLLSIITIPVMVWLAERLLFATA